jgi:FkbM family methyltransferase
LVDFVFRTFQQHTRASEVVRLTGGLTIRCNLWDEVQNNIWWLGTGYENAETSFFLRTLEPGTCFVDVGANVGYYTLLAARCVGEAGRVHSFEPVSAQFEALRGNVLRNSLGNCVLNKQIVADSEGLRSIYTGCVQNTGAASVVRGPTGDTTCEEVESVTLDHYIRGERPRLVKIDTEGYELFVLRGASHMLRECSPLLMVEVKNHLLKAAGCDRDELFAFLRSHGYRAFQILRNGTLSELSAPADGKLIVFKRV